MNEIEETIYKYALLNAVKYNGKADLKAVNNKIFQERPDLRKNAREIVKLVEQIVARVNSMTLEEQRRELESKYPELLEGEKKVESKKSLPPLPNVKGIVITRFAPNPDGPLHLGNARAAILSYEYARMYNGKFILRFDDTDPKIKKPVLEAYEWIKEDLEWLGIKWDAIITASSRLVRYYEIVRELISKGHAYVDICKEEEFKKYRNSGLACPHRSQDINTNLELWEKMLNGEFREGEAVVRIKTDLSDPDPSQRDWVMIRIIDTKRNPHPLVGDKFHLWPTYNFASSVDDHDLNVTHILRAKEHMANTAKQRWIFGYMNWEMPTVLEFGRLKLEGFMMSKSKIKLLLEKGITRDDPRLPTLSALRRRGILPETIKEIIIDVGLKVNDATISFENIAAINRKKIDSIAERIMFVKNPKPFILDIPNKITATIQVSPSSKEVRVIEVEPQDVILLDIDDVKEVKKVRLMELCNVEIKGDRLLYISKDLNDAKREGLKIIQWVKKSEGVKTDVIIPNGDELKIEEGYSESYIKKLGSNKVVQFVRYGFVRIEEIREDRVRTIFSHS
ncbi:MAG: glutamate--tRNA ligase [Sulfolobaceae archaeon]